MYGHPCQKALLCVLPSKFFCILLSNVSLLLSSVHPSPLISLRISLKISDQKLIRVPTSIAFEESRDNKVGQFVWYCGPLWPSGLHVMQPDYPPGTSFLKFIITVDVLYMCMTGLHASVSLARIIGTGASSMAARM
jgi:hypothetical protein